MPIIRDAVALQQSALDHLDGAGERTLRAVAVAGDDQQAANTRFAGKAREQIVERIAALADVAHRQMRDRLETGRAHAAANANQVGQRPRRNRG